MPSRSDRRQIRELLATAQGYAVWGPDGRRIGTFIELAVSEDERIAIRHDGVFLWRRRLLPVATVARVDPEQRIVVLRVDREALGRTETAPATAVAGAAGAAEEQPLSDEEWQSRIERYLSSGESRGEEADADRDGVDREPSTEDARRQPPIGREGGWPTPEPRREDQQAAERHLLFVATSSGYALVEREGPPPALGGDVEAPELSGPFLVAKLGPSPLPNDPRVCAYLEHRLAR